MGGDGRGAEFIVQSILAELRAYPDAVKGHIGFNIRLIQSGEMPAEAKQMKGFDPPVIELVEQGEGNRTYRCCVTVRLKHRIYILHVFQKKSTHGDETPKKELETIRRRLRRAVERDADYERAEQQKLSRRGA